MRKFAPVVLSLVVAGVAVALGAESASAADAGRTLLNGRTLLGRA